MSKKTAASTPAPIQGRRIQTRRSGVHGKGVFALTDFAEGETIIEYVGEIISWKEALRRHPHDPTDPNHTFYFHIDETHVIDAKYGGNSSRWINHSCKPSCEPDEVGGRVFIKAIRDIKAGEATGEIALCGTNLTDRKHAANYIDFGPGFGSLTPVYYIDPRMGGIEFKLRW